MARPTADVPADTTMMGVVHDALRRDLSRVDVVLAEVPPPDDDRRRAIADHVLWMMDFLHDHHTTEDVALWPLVRKRNPAAATLLDRMDAEHETISPAIEQVRGAAARYREDPAPPAHEALVSALATLSTPLLSHLDDEETEAMPVVSASITDGEWRDLDQKYNVRGKSLGRLAVEGHWLMDGLDRARYQKLASLVPSPVRIVIEKGYARRYRRACALRWGPRVPVGPRAT
jgi:hemerythrin-like domain-containing protein